MSKIRAAVGAAVLAAALVATAAPRAEAAGTLHGCPLGDVCVYPQNAGYNGDRPSLRFFTYGAHNLSNQFGTHRVVNNQTGHALAWLCLGFNGTGGSNAVIGSPTAFDFNLTPINSIKLTTSSGTNC